MSVRRVSGHRLPWCNSRLVALLAISLTGCGSDLVRVERIDMPAYELRSNQPIATEVHLYIEPGIPLLEQIVRPDPQTDPGDIHPIVVGPALEEALFNVSRDHFSSLELVRKPGRRPLISYELLDYRPELKVIRSGLTSTSHASARIVLRTRITQPGGHEIVSAAVFGTSHVSDNRYFGGLKHDSNLLAAATHDAIVDAMYKLSNFYANNRTLIVEQLSNDPLRPSTDITTLDGVMMYYETRKPNY